MAVNRYKQLLISVPQGDFYASDGQVLPFRNTPYQLRINTGVATRQYSIFNNNQFVGSTTTDVNGIALVNVSLALGTNQLQLIDSITQQSSVSYATTREYATWLASEAQIIEELDADTEQILTDARLATSSSSMIETVFGSVLNTANNPNYILDTYRELLQELRAAYRYWGGTVEGISRAVRAFTQISPLIYPREFGPAWILGKNIIAPKENPGERTYYTTSTLTNLNAFGASCSVSGIGSGVGVGTGTIKYFNAPPQVSFTAPGAPGAGPLVQITGNGTYTLYGQDSTQSVIGFAGPYNIQTGVNDQLWLSLDGLGIIQITLPSGGTQSAATLATSINSAFNSDHRYGGTYNTVASAYDFYGSGTPHLTLTSPNATSSFANITVYLAVGTHDASQTLFDVPQCRGGFASISDPTTLVLSASTNMNLFPQANSDNTYDILVGGTTFHATGAPTTPIDTSTQERVTVNGLNRGTRTLRLVSPGLLNTHTAGAIVYPAGEGAYQRAALDKFKSVTLTVNGFSAQLPPGNTVDNFTISGQGVPDNWILTDESNTPISPPSLPLLLPTILSGSAGGPVSAQPQVYDFYFDPTGDLPFLMAQNTEITIPVPDEILKYKGFTTNIVFWAKQDDPSRPSPNSISKISYSFNNQLTYTDVTPTVNGKYISSVTRPLEYIITTTVPSSATKMWIRAKMGASGGGVIIDRVRVTVPVGHGGLFLGNGTTPRSESRVKQGLFMYVWSRDPLLSTEKQLIGTTSPILSKPLGHIDQIAPAEAQIDRYDASTYDINNNPTDIYGVFNDVDMIAGTMTNLSLVLRTPARFSYMSPTVINTHTDTLTFAVTPPYSATLSLTSDQNPANAYLIQDGVPLTQDQWSFASQTQINLLNPPSSTSVYTFTYNALIRFESAPVDLTANFANYLWFADYHVFARPEITPNVVPITAAIQFGGNSQAVLAERSDEDQSSSTLTENTGLSTRTVPTSLWNYVDHQTISISPTAFNASSIYTLTYSAEVNHPSTNVQVTYEIKSASSSGGLATATYQQYNQNQVVDNTNEWHQFRITLNGVRDTRDARVHSLLMKGLGLFGTGLTVPVLNPPPTGLQPPPAPILSANWLPDYPDLTRRPQASVSNLTGFSWVKFP